MLSAATTSPFRPKIGAATQRTPISCSSLSTANPCRLDSASAFLTLSGVMGVCSVYGWSFWFLMICCCCASGSQASSALPSPVQYRGAVLPIEDIMLTFRVWVESTLCR